MKRTMARCLICLKLKRNHYSMMCGARGYRLSSCAASVEALEDFIKWNHLDGVENYEFKVKVRRGAIFSFKGPGQSEKR